MSIVPNLKQSLSKFCFLFFNLIPNVFNSIQVRRERRPFNSFFIQPFTYCMSSMFFGCMIYFWFKLKSFCKISRYFSPFMLLPIKTRFSTSEEDNQPPCFTFSSPYLTVGAIHLRWCSPDHNFAVGSKQVQSTFIGQQHAIPET